jgi:hypothetical protein
MRTVPFNVFHEPEIQKFNAICERHNLNSSDFYVLGLVNEMDGPLGQVIRIRVEYLPTSKAAHYLSGHSMSWLVSFEIDLGKKFFS